VVAAKTNIKDQAKAAKALEALTKLTGAPADQPVTTKPYRKTKIVPMAGALKVAMTKDRLIIALGQTAMTAAIDTALDETGALAADSKGGKLLKLAGDGSAVFQIDLAEMVKMVWPLLIASTQQDAKYGRAPSFPLASIPSTGKMARMLSPEIAVFKSDKGGLLMKSRGKIPFVTKIIPVFSITSGIPMLFMMGR
jgi:hypothetical protein